MGRFDYVKYDEQATAVQGIFKALMEQNEKAIDDLLISPRAKSLALTKLEEAYMWVGKAVRDDQIVRSEHAVKLQEERKDG